MGNLCTNDGDKEKDKQLNKELLQARREDQGVKKLLLLGPGNSGKSTFFKQLLQIHGDGFPEKITSEAAKSVYDSVLEQIKVLVQNAEEKDYPVIFIYIYIYIYIYI